MKILSDLFTVYPLSNIKLWDFGTVTYKLLKIVNLQQQWKIFLFLQLVAVPFHLLNLNSLLQLSACIWIFLLETSVVSLPITNTFKEFQENMDFAIKKTL